MWISMKIYFPACRQPSYIYVYCCSEHAASLFHMQKDFLVRVTFSIYGTTLISGTRGVKNGVKGGRNWHLLHGVDHVTVSHFFLACTVKCHEICCPFCGGAKCSSGRTPPNYGRL